MSFDGAEAPVNLDCGSCFNDDALLGFSPVQAIHFAEFAFGGRKRNVAARHLAPSFAKRWMVKLPLCAIEICAIKQKIKNCLAVHVVYSVVLLMALLSAYPQ